MFQFRRFQFYKYRSLELCLLGLLFVGSGCSLVSQLPAPLALAADITQGEYYIENQKFAAGIKRFEPIVQQNPHDGRAHYYLGRFYLAENKPLKARTNLIHAVRLSPRHADGYFWLGVAHAANNQPALEYIKYKQALKINRNHIQARVYLGHTMMSRKKYAEALKHYDQALEINDYNPQALYNRALALYKLKRYPEEVEAWKIYLAYYPLGPFARRAVGHLNAGGNFDYRNYLISHRIIPLKRIAFEPATIRPTKETRKYLKYLTGILKQSPSQTLHILIYQQNNLRLAKRKAHQLKKIIKGHLKENDPSRIKTSWFGVPENIDINGKRFTEPASVNLFTLKE